MFPTPDHHIEAEEAEFLLAVRYLLEECTPREVADFEARLATDSSAQESLVEATRIVVLLQSTTPCPLSRSSFTGETNTHHAAVIRPNSHFWPHTAWIAAGLLAVLAISWQYLAPQSSLNRSPPSVAAVERAELSRAWLGLESEYLATEISSLVEEVPSFDDTHVAGHLRASSPRSTTAGAVTMGAVMRNNETVSPVITYPGATHSNSASDDEEVPDWMLAAVLHEMEHTHPDAASMQE